MNVSDIYIGAAVTHWRGDYRGTIVRVVEQPDPAPLHVDVQSADGMVRTAPITELFHEAGLEE